MGEMRAVAPFLARDWNVQRVDALPSRPPAGRQRPGKEERPTGSLRRVRLLLTSLVVR
jgi:hypothetical protein